MKPPDPRGTICPFSREMQTVFLKRGRDHPELLGRWEKGREQIRLTLRGRRAEPEFHGAMPPVAIGPATRGGYWNERPATWQTCHHPLNTQARCRGLRAWTICYDALVGATTPTDNKRVCQPAPRALEATDRHQSESFQGQANQWQGGTCHRKFRADERRLPRVSPRQLPQRNRKDS